MALRPVKIIIAGVDKFSKTFSDSQKKLKKLSSGMTSIGKKMSVGLTLPIVGAGVAAMKASMNFNEAMGNVQSLGLSGKRINELKKNVLDVSDTTAESATETANGLYQVISAYGDSADAAGQLRVSALAAKAGLASTTDAVALISAVTKGYGDTSAIAQQHASDLAFTAVKLGQTTFPELAASIGKVTPFVTQLGVSQEELFNIFGTFTGVTGNAAEVSTQLKAALSGLLTPTEKMTKLYAASGYANGKALIKAKGLGGALKFVNSAATAAGIPLADLSSSIEGQTLIMSLAGAQWKTFMDKQKEFNDTAGATQKAFDAQTKGINKSGFAFAQMKARLERMFIKLGDVLAPVMDKLIDAVTPIVDSFSRLDPSVLAAISVFAGLAAAIGPVVLFAGQLISAFTTIAPIVSSLWGTISAGAGIWGALGGAFAVIINPITWVVAAIGAVIAVFVVLWNKCDKMRMVFKLLFNAVKFVFGGIFNFISMVFSKIFGVAKRWLQPVFDFVNGLFDKLLKLANFLPDSVKKAIGFDEVTKGLYNGTAEKKKEEDYKENSKGLSPEFNLSQKEEGKTPENLVTKVVTKANENVAQKQMTDFAKRGTQNNEFKGTLVIKGLPRGSSMTVDKGKMDIDLQTGLIMGGV